jgi:hypothetical protein
VLVLLTRKVIWKAAKLLVTSEYFSASMCRRVRVEAMPAPLSYHGSRFSGAIDLQVHKSTFPGIFPLKGHTHQSKSLSDDLYTARHLWPILGQNAFPSPVGEGAVGS